MLDDMTAKQIAGYLKAKKAPDGISFNDGYNVATYGITMDEYRAIDRAMHDAYGLSPKRTPAGVREALRVHGPSASRHHATKKSTAQLDWEIEIASTAAELTKRDRGTLAWIIENEPYPYRGSPYDDVERLVEIGLLDPPSEDKWGKPTSFGRAVWEHARKTWLEETALGAAYRRS